MEPGERIREFREKKGIDQKDFAEMLGFSRGYISQIENGIRKPSREFLKKLNEVFGISSDYILYGNPPDQVGVDLEAPPEEYKERMKEAMIIREPESKYQVLPTAIKKLIDNVVEILQSDNEVMADLLRANIKGLLEAIRSKKNDKNKSKGGN